MTVTVDEAASTEHHFATVVRGPVVLWHGPIDADAHLERLVAAYDLLATWIDPTAHLIVAGPSADPAVAEHLRRYAVELALPHVWIAPDVTPAVLAVMRRHAAVELTGPVPDAALALLAEHLAARAGVGGPEGAG